MRTRDFGLKLPSSELRGGGIHPWIVDGKITQHQKIMIEGRSFKRNRLFAKKIKSD